MKKIVVCSCLMLLSCCAHANSWTVLLYAESDASLNDAVFKNINDLMRAQSSDQVTIAVQLHCWEKTAWRFIVKDHALHHQEDCLLSCDPANDLIEGVRWAFTHFPAEHYLLILGSHGYGILDPIWSDEVNDWVVQVPEDMAAECPFKGAKHVNASLTHMRSCHRGVLFYPPNITHGYLTNQGMVHAFSVISHDILRGKKIDIVGMDACRMAMIEIAYQIAPFACYLIGTQDCELKDGWDYYALGNFIAEGNKTPREVAISEVYAYSEYYKNNAPKGYYTQSAIDLSRVAAIADNLNKIITYILENVRDLSQLKEIVHVARKQQPAFCEMPSYIDIANFYQMFRNGLLRGDLHAHEDLVSLLDQGITLIYQAVIANVTGVKSTHAHGISIYFPRFYQLSSYADCIFAQDTAWCEFLVDLSETVSDLDSLSLVYTA